VKTLITGATGMIGTEFVRALSQRGWPIWGLARNSASGRLAGRPREFEFIGCDVLERDAVVRILRRVQPDLVIHLAAQAFNSVSWDSEYITHTTNYFGTLNVLNAVRAEVPNARVLVACSSAEYGMVPENECPIREERLLRPVSPYGVSKVATENLAHQYFANYGMKIYLPRLFIHVGTGHPPATAIQNYARQLASVARGVATAEIRVGNLETSRDFIDVRDGVAGMLKLVESGRCGEPVNICTGKAHSIREVLHMLMDISGQRVKVVADAGLGRPSDEKILLGDSAKLRSLGWHQRYTFQETLEAVYKDWFERVNEA
jgi:GDP-4-dehydro-6-deoxy-D-mannose reductase